MNEFNKWAKTKTNFKKSINQKPNFLPAQMLQRLNVFKSRYGMKKLHSHRTEDRPTVQEEQISTATRVFDSIFYEFYYCLTFELCKTSKTEVP